MKIKKRYLFPAVMVVVLLAGPRPDFQAFDGKLPEMQTPLSGLDDYLRQKEAKVAGLKANNESRIVWADSVRKTPYSLVYLHGWSASPEEGDPVNREFAKRYGCNLYLPRLAGHGLNDKNSFAKLTPKELIESAKEALAIGKLLGDKVILMSCSTGGTLSIYLSATNPGDVAAQFLFSPNIDIADPTSELLTLPWGKQLAHIIIGPQRTFTPPPGGEKYWTTTYSTDGLICLKSLIETTMQPAIWQQVKQPLFMGYYYKNEQEKDPVVSVDEMKVFFDAVSTPADKKLSAAFPDAGAHVVISSLHSKDLASVRKETFAFAERVLGLVPLEEMPVK